MVSSVRVVAIVAVVVVVVVVVAGVVLVIGIADFSATLVRRSAVIAKILFVLVTLFVDVLACPYNYIKLQ